MDDRQLVEGCLQGDAQYQKRLFDRYSGLLMTVSRRYTRDDLEAEDVLQDAFVLIFNKLDTFAFKGKLISWMRRITVNVALRKLQSKERKDTHYILDHLEEPAHESDFVANLTAEEILSHIQKLPEGYRKVFNLYAIDGYSHKEIAEQLSVAESTSRSQLTKARKMLQQSLASLKHVLL